MQRGLVYTHLPTNREKNPSQFCLQVKHQNSRSRNNFTLDNAVPDLGYLIEIVIIIRIAMIVTVGSGEEVHRPINHKQQQNSGLSVNSRKQTGFTTDHIKLRYYLS